MGMYFGPEVDVKIAEYVGSTDPVFRNKVFNEGIRPALVKLIESQMYLYGFYKIDDPETLKNECLSQIFETLPKFDPNKGKKAFSYFNVVVKNWFIWKIREKNKRLRQQASSFYGIDHDVVKNDPSLVLSSYEDEVVEREFWVSLLRNMDTWREVLKKPQEVAVLDAVVFLLQNPHLVSIYNKKAVFLYIREISALTPKQVNHNINRMKELYLAFREKFDSGEEV